MGIIEQAKRNELHKTTVVCRGCNKAIKLDNCTYNVINAQMLDTYIFYCSNGQQLLTFDFEYKKETIMVEV